MKKTIVLFLMLLALFQSHEVMSANNLLPAPDSLRVKPQTNGALLTWQPVAGADGYRVYWERDANVSDSSPCLSIVASGQQKYEVNDLFPGVLYHFAVSAYRSTENGSLSNQVGVIPSSGKGQRLSQDGTH